MFSMVQRSNGYGAQSLGWNPITSLLLFKGSLFFSSSKLPFVSCRRVCRYLVFIGRPVGITGLVAIDHATEVVSPFWEITYS